MLTSEETIDRVLLRIIRVCFVLLFLFVPLYFSYGFDTKELFEFDKMLVVYALTTVITGAWLSRMVIQRRFIWQPSMLDIPLLLFLISQLLSTIFSIHPRTSLLGYYSRYHGGLLSTISYLLLYWSFVTHVRKQDIPTYFLLSLVGGLLVSIYAIPEHFGHSASCLLVPSARTFDVSCWKQDVQSRVFATFGQPNWLAAYAITLIPIGGFLAAFSKLRTTRVFATIVTVALFVTLLFTQSRSGLLGLGVAAGVGLSLVLLRLAHSTQSIKKLDTKLAKRILLVALPLGVALLIFGSVYTPSLRQLLERNSSTVIESESEVVANRLDLGGSSSAEIRRIVWKGALAVWQRYPVLGSGVETFAYSYYLDRPIEHNLVSEWNFLYNKAHNEFLNLLATTGIVGLVSYLSILLVVGFLGVQTVANAKATTADTAKQILLLCGIIGLSVSNFFGFSTVTVSVLLFFYLACLAILQRTSNNETIGATSPPSLQKISSFGWLQLTVLTGVTGFLLLAIGNTRRADTLYARGTQAADQQLWELALQDLTNAVMLSPREAQYTDTLALTYAQAAVAVGLAGDATSSSQLAITAVELSDQTLQLNPEQRNFYKTRAQIFITLAQLEPPLLAQAKVALEQVLALAPTDAKTMYNLGIVSANLGDAEETLKWLRTAIEFKPNYDAARWELSKQLLQQEKYDLGIRELEYILSRDPSNQAAQELLDAARSQQKQ
ncbi:MAG: O-antigen ligase family protein [bacterium]|nr:O-antigen ligase family protein [bacterium]